MCAESGVGHAAVGGAGEVASSHPAGEVASSHASTSTETTETVVSPVTAADEANKIVGKKAAGTALPALVDGTYNIASQVPLFAELLGLARSRLVMTVHFCK